RSSPLVLPVALDEGAVGAMVFALPAHRAPEDLRFARAAAQVVSASLRAARAIESGRAQGALLARRNADLEALREFAARLQERSSEEAILETAIDLVLAHLGLEAGWIFWGEESRGRLELAAARGVSEAFVRNARAGGIGVCLCLDVFDSGRRRVARNT